MNFRCDGFSSAEAKQVAARNDIYALRSADQLCTGKSGDALLWRFHEDEINFLPTFKYDKNSALYDTSKKQRVPSYTDRILFSINEGHPVEDYQLPAPHKQRVNGNQVFVDFYNRRESLFSDHRPVLGVFKVAVRKVNTRKLAAIRAETLRSILQRSQQRPD